MNENTSRQWDQHILVVFSVLAGLVFQKIFDSLEVLNFSLAMTILSIGVFYVVLDNWYCLHRDLNIFNVDKPIEVVFYMFSILVYSCLPFLYGVNPEGTTPERGCPESFAFNLSLICFFDSARKAITIWKYRSGSNLGSLDEAKRRLLGRYVFHVMTGVLYTFLLFMLMKWHRFSDFNLTGKAIFIVGVWVCVRLGDVLAVPKLSNFSARMVFGTNVTPSPNPVVIPGNSINTAASSNPHSSAPPEA